MDACCPTCRYALTGLPASGACPECRSVYAPENSRAPWPTPRRRDMLWTLGWPLLTLLTGVTFTIWAEWARVVQLPGLLLTTAGLAGCLLFVPFMASVYVENHVPPAVRARGRVRALRTLGVAPLCITGASVIAAACAGVAGVLWW